MAKLPRKPLLALMALATLFAWGPTYAASDEFLCDATQASSNELPILDVSCPIGNGMWGNKAPAPDASLFWIQCGLFSKPLPLSKAKPLYKQIETDVWAKPEKKGYRCLIGPYKDIARARKDLKRVNTLAGYEKAFIRQVSGNQASPETGSATVPAPKAPMTKKAAPVAASTKAMTDKTQKTTVITPPQGDKGTSRGQSINGAIADFDVDIRRTTRVAGVTYFIPYFMHGKEQFYMEHGLPWNRMDYNEANLTCKALGMRLPSAPEWKKLLDGNIMTKEQWPMHLPYWGLERIGLFTSGKVNQLKGTSLLNIMCVQ